MEVGVWGQVRLTWTMATCKRLPRRPTTIEAAAMTVGPVRNLTPIENVAIEFPHATILGCNAMNNPIHYKIENMNFLKEKK